MRTTIFKAALAVGLFGVVEVAEAQQQTTPVGGVRATGALTQSFEFRDNDNVSGSFESLSGLDFSLSSQTPTTTVTASTGFALSLDEDGASLARPKLTLGFANRGKRSNVTGNVSFSRAPIIAQETASDLSIVNVDADQTVVSGNFGVSTRLNPTTNISFGLKATQIDFDPLTASLSPTLDYDFSGKINYRLNNRTTFGLGGNLGFFEAENSAETRSLSAGVTSTLSHELTNVSTFDGNFGFAFIDTTDTVGTATTSAFSVSLLFGAGLTQQLPDGSMGISIDQSINPSAATGSLALGTRLNGSLTRNVNPSTSYSIDASLGRQEDVGGGTVTTFLNVSPSYTRQVTRDVSATASYYFQRDNAGSTAQGLTLSFSRPFDFPVR